MLDDQGVPSKENAAAENYNIHYAGTTVALKNAALKTPLYIPGGTTIELLGTNTIVSADDQVSTCVQTMTAGNLTITGTGSLTGYSSSGDGIIVLEGSDEQESNILIEGGTIDMSAVRTSVNARYGSIYINGSAKVIADHISADKNIEISGSAEVNTVNIDADQKAVMKGNSKVTVFEPESQASYGGLYGDYGIDVLENAEVSSSVRSGAFNAFYGLSGSAINLKDSDVTVASTTNAFLQTPTLDYSMPVTISADDDADSAVMIPQSSVTAADYQKKYVKIVPAQQISITYKQSEEDAAPDVRQYDAGDEVTVASVSAREGYVFTGWKDEAGKVYPAGATFTPTGDMTLTAQWKTAQSWIEEDRDTTVDLNMDVQIAVDDAVKTDISAAVKDGVDELVKGGSPEALGAENAGELRDLINSGAEQIEKLEDAHQTLLDTKKNSGEEIQVWNLSVTMQAEAIDNHKMLDTVDQFAVTRLWISRLNSSLSRARITRAKRFVCCTSTAIR